MDLRSAGGGGGVAEEQRRGLFKHAAASGLPAGGQNHHVAEEAGTLAAEHSANLSSTAGAENVATTEEAGGNRGGTVSNIAIFLRVRPVARPSPRMLVDATDACVEFNIPKDAVAGWVQAQRSPAQALS